MALFNQPNKGKTNDTADRRVFVRLKKTLTVYYTLIKDPASSSKGAPGAEMRAETKDISAGGLAFYLKESIPVHAMVEVRIPLPGHAEPIVCLAEVVRSRAVDNTPFCDTALNFLDLSGRDRQILDRFVKKEIG